VDEAYATAISVISSRLRNTWLSRSPTAIFVGQEWSPDWSFTDDEFAATATSFDKPAHEEHFPALLEVRVVHAGHNVLRRPLMPSPTPFSTLTDLADGRTTSVPAPPAVA
jgi:hypothetical protein